MTPGKLLIALVVVMAVGVLLGTWSSTTRTPTTSDEFTRRSQMYCQGYAEQYHLQLGLTPQAAYDQCRSDQNYTRQVLNGTINTTK